jgi:hypothetical protein
VEGKRRSFCSAAYPGFYGALLDQKVYWEQTLRAEGAVRLELPQTNYSDGVELANKAYHSLVRAFKFISYGCPEPVLANNLD